MSLSDEDTGVMNRLGELSLLDEGLKSSLKELGGGQTEDIIELALVVLQKTKSNHTSDEGLTFEKSSWIVIVHSEKNTSSLSIMQKSSCEIVCQGFVAFVYPSIEGWSSTYLSLARIS